VSLEFKLTFLLFISSGTVLCKPTNLVPVTSTFEAQIVVFDIKIPITSGFPVILHHQSLNEPASIVKLVATIDKATGEIIKKNPRYVHILTVKRPAPPLSMHRFGRVNPNMIDV
jgi:translation elongation factor EF-1alpha